MASGKQLFILSAPSGAGKTTIAHHLLQHYDSLAFSVSATTRPRRPGEVHGKDYYFLTREEFQQRIAQDDLVEYEEIFGNYYGTLKSEVRKALDEGKCLIFDVDVKGALSLYHAFPDESLLIFIAPPSLDILQQRLISRNTESPEQLELRLARAKMEMDMQDKFDVIIINDNLEKAFGQAEEMIQTYLPH